MPAKELPVFVYGTLKKGKYFHNLYLGRNSCLGDFFITDDFSLYFHNWPILVKEKSDRRVKGEVYIVDTATLDRLDYLEGHPGFYKREKVMGS